MIKDLEWGPLASPCKQARLCIIFNDVLVSSTLALPVIVFTWKKEKLCSPGETKIFVSPGEHIYKISNDIIHVNKSKYLTPATETRTCGSHGFKNVIEHTAVYGYNTAVF